MKYFILLLTLFMVSCGEVPTTDDTAENDPAEEETVVVDENLDPLTIRITENKILVNQVIFVKGRGGLPPYSYSLIRGTGELNPITGQYTASSDEEEVEIKVEDENGNEVIGYIDTVNFVDFSSNIKDKLMHEEEIVLSGQGGFPPYSYFISKGSGIISSGMATGFT